MLSDSSTLIPILFLASFLTAIVSLLVLRRALRGVRLGHGDPTCPSCDYLLVGLALPTPCPECGTAVDIQTVARGRRVPRPRLLALASAALATSIAVGWFTGGVYYPRVDWVAYRPTFLLISDLGTPFKQPPGFIHKQEPFAEMARRIAADSLSESQLRRLAAKLLSLAASNNAPNALAMLEGLYLRRQLTPDEARQFLRYRIVSSLAVRPIVVAGDPVPFSFTLRDPLRYSLKSPGTVIVRAQSWRVDQGPSHPAITAVTWTDSFSLQPVIGARSLARCNSPGPHTLHVTFQSQVVDPESDNPLPTSVEFTLSAPFNVIAEEPPGYVSPTPPIPSLETHIRTFALSGNLITIDDHGNPSLRLYAHRVPQNIAFDVFVRDGGVEYAVGTFDGGPKETHTFTYRLPLSPQTLSDTMDLVLRPSQAVARQTVDLSSYADLEVAIPLTVERPNP